VFVPGKYPVKVQPKILDVFFLGELHTVYMNRGAGFSSCSECYVDEEVIEIVRHRHGFDLRSGTNLATSDFASFIPCAF
jgi:hypothetical protein